MKKILLVSLLLTTAAAFAQTVITTEGDAIFHTRKTTGSTVIIADSLAPFTGLKVQLGLTPSGGHTVTLSCTPPFGGGTVTGYQFSRGTVSGGPYTAIGSQQSTCAYTDADPALTEGTTYYYVAQSVGPGGTSADSTQASALIPFLPPGIPTGLQATPH